ncbi:SH3 domain-containing protein [Acrocarpospora catenulata]|uniref:SH3 domain-containing protein n=1 Tax=Acrocarpospora catenulata TaxID=2836182 RepID=UPI001BD94E22|nr:hypothetical protein [Acrocarpospora catenulata]
MDLIRPAILAATATGTMLGLATSAQAAVPLSPVAYAAVNISPTTVHAGQSVKMTTTACGTRPAYANSPALTGAATLATNGYQASGTGTVSKNTLPGKYTVTVTCQSQTQAAAVGTLTVSAKKAVVHYRVVHVRYGHHLRVRSGPSLHHRVVGTLNWRNAHVHGSPTTHTKWVKVTADNGRTGWAYAYYLRAR